MSELIDRGGVAPKDLLKRRILQVATEGADVVRTYSRREPRAS